MAELAALFRSPKGGPIEKVASDETGVFLDHSSQKLPG